MIEAQSDLMNPLGVAESPSVRIRMINGIQNSLHYARETARWLAKSAQYPVHYTYNPSNSFFTDMWECLTMMRGKMVSSVDRTVSELARQIIADAKSVDTPVFVAHSQGVMILNRALESASTLTENWDALKKKIRIYTYGGPEVVEDTGYQKVKNYQGSHDPISRFTPKETSAPIKVARPTVPPRGIPFDHGIRGPSYGELLTRKMRKLTVPGGG